MRVAFLALAGYFEKEILNPEKAKGYEKHSATKIRGTAQIHHRCSR